MILWIPKQASCPRPAQARRGPHCPPPQQSGGLRRRPPRAARLWGVVLTAPADELHRNRYIGGLCPFASLWSPAGGRSPFQIGRADFPAIVGRLRSALLSGRRRTDRRIHRGRPADLRLEVTDEVGLIEVATLAGERGGVEPRSRCQALGGLVDPEAANDPLGAHPDVLMKEPLQGPH